MSRWLSPGVHFKDDPQVRVCARCGYPFPSGQHGAPAACSECGTYIDPTKAGLLRSLAPNLMLQRALRAPGLWSMGLIALCACALAIAQAVPGGYALWSIAAIAGIVVMMLIVGMRLLVALVVARKLRPCVTCFTSAGGGRCRALRLLQRCLLHRHFQSMCSFDLSDQGLMPLLQRGSPKEAPQRAPSNWTSCLFPAPVSWIQVWSNPSRNSLPMACSRLR